MGRRRFSGMFKVVWLVVCTLFFVGGQSQEAAAWIWGDPSLVTINDEKFSTQDYRNWWQNWQEENMSVPESPDDFVNWQLMAQEGSRMQLESEPAYQRKVETFVKVRSLMILKQEEIDSKVKPSRKEMWAIYEKDYCPRWNIAVLFFETEELAAEKGKALRAKATTVEALKEVPAEKGGPLFYEAKWLRYPKVKEDWLSSLEGKRPGYFTDPMPMGKHFIILNFVEERGPEEEDFNKVKKAIESKVVDRQSAELTAKLVEKLKKKYEVQVDEEFLTTIGETPLDLETAEKPVVQTSKQNVSAGDLQAMMAKERQFRKQYKFQAEEAEALKKRVVANLLAQTLISWEARDRHFEEKEPFKPVYEFYTKHRLAKEIEKRFIRPKAKLDEGEAKAYYEKNQEKYSHPEMISYILVEGEEELIKRMRQDIVQGEDFFAVVEKHFPGGVPAQQLPVSHLDTALQGPVLGLKKGEVSQPFALQKNFAMAKLVNRRQAMPVPFMKVKDEIVKKLTDEKFASSRQEFLDQLKEQSTIKVNAKAWQKLRKELVKKDEGKENK